MDKNISKKLTYLYFVLTLMIIGLHSVSAKSMGFTGISLVVNDYFRIFFDCATGTFFFMSAFLLYRKQHKYILLLKDKVKSLLIPYILYNFIMFVYKDIFRNLVLNQAISCGNFFDFLFYIISSKANPPLWFIRVLMGYIILYPLFDKLISRKKLGISIIIFSYAFLILFEANIGYSTNFLLASYLFVWCGYGKIL